MSRRIRLSTSASVLALVLAGGGRAIAQEGATVALPEVVVVAQSPVPGTPQVDINKVPQDVSIVSAEDFRQRYSPSVADAITAHVPGAIALNIDGSDLSPDLFIRGYDASRITGTPIGLAVYENGVRINERFGDNVNLDLIPPIAIADANVYTANPIFGLNALGGAINFVTKNGFTFHGGDAMIYGGSFGRVNGNLEYGKQVGNYSFYFAGDLYKDDGYRPFGAQNAERFLADLGYRSQDAEVHLIGQFGRSLLGVQGVTPQVLVAQQYNSVFTTPQTTNNQAGTAQLTASVNVAPRTVINSNFYIRQFDQVHIDGNDADVTDCSEVDGMNGGTLCLSPDDVGAKYQTSALLQFVHNGQPIPSLGFNTDLTPYGTTASTYTHTTAVGTQQQLTNTSPLFGHDNNFVIGGSIDSSSTHFSSTTTLGLLNAAFQNQYSGVPGAGDILQTAGNVGFNSTYIASQRNDYGIFVLDTFNLTKQLAITAGARYNQAVIATQDLSGYDPGDNARNVYERINPTVGATYEFAKALTIFGSYSETNRAPTPLETNCANPNQPCLLETALVSDPPLQQVVARTIEAGGRGTVALPYVGGLLHYKADYYHSAATNDILTLPSAISGQGYFANVPQTLRQGVEAGVIYTNGPLTFYGNYALVNATYQFSSVATGDYLSSPNNPNPQVQANGGLETINPGNHIPGIPENIIKLGFEYKITPRWLVGMDGVIVGSQYYAGDDSNLNSKLPAYYFLNLHTSYQITDHIEVFGFVNNLTNNHYSTYGTYYDTGTDAGNINAALAANNPDNGGAGNANSVTVAQPISFYGGVKINF